jgi:hypothetical protein
MKITRYKLAATSAKKIDDLVNKLIGEGWQPFGAPVVLPPTPDIVQEDTVYQAMIQSREEHQPTR